MNPPQPDDTATKQPVFTILAGILVILTLYIVYKSYITRYIVAATCATGERLGLKPIDYTSPSKDQMLMKGHANTTNIKIETPYPLSYWYTNNGSSVTAIYLPGYMTTRGYSFGPSIIRYLSEILDINVISIDYRGTADNVGEYSEPTMIEDAITVVKHATKYLSDQKIIICAFSISGNIGIGLNAAMVKMNLKPSGIVLIAPTIRFSMNEKMNYLFMYWFQYIHAFVFNSNVIDAIDCPVYLFHSTNDKISPAQNSIELSRILIDRGKLANLYIAKRKGHNYILTDATVTNTLIDFVKKLKK